MMWRFCLHERENPVAIPTWADALLLAAAAAAALLLLCCRLLCCPFY